MGFESGPWALMIRPRNAFLGIDYSQIRSIVADTASIGFTGVTGGSRVTFVTGMAVIDASKRWSTNCPPAPR